MNTHDYIESLIAKVLAGEATPSEIAEVEAWRSSDAANDDYFLILKEIFEKAPEARTQQQFNTDNAWIKLKGSLNPEGNSGGEIITMPSKVASGWWKIAAVITIMALIGWMGTVLFDHQPASLLAISSGTSTLDTLLPDNTVVFMNKNATVTYENTKTKRAVTLTGEAFFEIAPNASLPFVIEAGSLEITDIGTSFHVNAPANHEPVIVFVESGEVKLTTLSGKTLNLTKGEEGRYIKANDVLVKMEKADTNITSYKTRIFVFENAALETVVRKLNEVYGSEIVITAAIENCHLTATFRNEQLDSIIAVIAETLGLEIKKEGERIWLEGNSCDQ